MAEAISTHLRYAFSKDPMLLTQWVNSLGFKIEIKEITHKNNRWYVWFVTPNSNPIEFGVDLDE